jgi:uncharacterized protein YlzI (FlbEa/FlbD family)
MLVSLKFFGWVSEDRELIINSDDISSMEEKGSNPAYTEVTMKTGKSFIVKQSPFEIDYSINNNEAPLCRPHQ